VNDATRITLVVGYLLAVPPLFGIVRALRHPDKPLRWVRVPARIALTSELIGAGCVVAGQLAMGNGPGAIFNGLWTVFVTTIWLRSENKLRLQRLAGTETGD